MNKQTITTNATNSTTNTATKNKNQRGSENMNANTTTVNATAGTMGDFDTLKRNLENAYANGADYAAPLAELSTVIAKACLNKCLDPQRKTAPQREVISDNGNNPMLLQLKNTLDRDNRLLENTLNAANTATELKFNKDGDLISEVVNQDANKQLNAVIKESLTDAIDLTQTAAAAILEQYAKHYNGQDNFLDWRYTARRLSKKVYIQAAESASYKDVETSPIQEVYRAVRRAIASSRSVQTDPRNGHTYIEDMTEDGLETIYRRMGKYADLGSDNGKGLYSGDLQTMTDYNAIIKALNLTDRQLTVVNLRMRGHGYKAIGTYLGVTPQAVQNALKRVQARAEKLGFKPQTQKAPATKQAQA